MGIIFNSYPNDFRKLITPILLNLGYVELSYKETDFSYIFEYSRDEIRLHFNYDIRDNFFYFYAIWGKNTTFPNDRDNRNIKPLQNILISHNDKLKQNDLQPNNLGYIKALENIAVTIAQNQHPIGPLLQQARSDEIFFLSKNEEKGNDGTE